MILAAIVICFQLGDSPPVQFTTTEPLQIQITRTETRISLGAWDRRMLARELRERGFDAREIAAALAPQPLTEDKSVRCGCTVGIWFALKKVCGAYQGEQMCVTCRPCPAPSGEPIAMVR